MRRWGQVALVFILSFLGLSYNVHRVGMASGDVDTVSHIAAQDEAVYSHISLRMALDGEWMTPKFLGRYAFFKPPLLYWLSAASVRVFGGHVFALRLPSLLAGAVVCVVLFALIGGWPGVVAVVLLLSDPLWHILSRLCLTDALLALWITVAMAGLMKAKLNVFSMATAAAILTKGIAGLIPLIALGLWWVIDPDRVPLRKLLVWLGLPILLVLPWFAAELWLHPKWFWAEFVQVEILGYSLGAPPQTSTENPVLFYGRRFFLTDAPLLLLLVVGLTRFRGDRDQRVLLAWILAVGVAVMGNQYRNVAYLLPAIPAFCWLAAKGLPERAAPIVASLLLIGFGIRAANPAEPWGLSFQPGTSIAIAPELERYSQLDRSNPLILVEPRDQFVATTLGLAHVRYCYIAGDEGYRRFGLDFRYLGIVLTLDEFEKLSDLQPVFHDRLRQWGHSAEPIGTVILLRDATEIPRLLAAAPQSDFVLPDGSFRLAEQ